jgi:uncharacterized protein YegP (UPF0339 family)
MITITTIIAILAALGTSIWAFIERNGKKLLSALIAELKAKEESDKAELIKVKQELGRERMMLADEQAKHKSTAIAFDDYKKQMESAPAIVEIRKSTPAFNIADVVDVTEEYQLKDGERSVHFEFYNDTRYPKELRWRLKAKNNKILADSGEGYGTKQNFKKALEVMISAIMNGQFKSKWKK